MPADTSRAGQHGPFGRALARLSLLIFDNSWIITVSARGVFLWDGPTNGAFNYQ